MLFVQGSRDAFGTPDELRPILDNLSAPAELQAIEGADHSFKVLRRSGRAQEEVYETILDGILAWLRHGLIERP
jgi:predicted alpha/beta-hydrolase family hydrolase